ncbi:hypothetical protein KR215_000936, partial [Drosophila sulfurigaster]
MLVCYNKKCRVPVGAKMGFVCCWLCDNAHEKCAGFNGRIVDLISAKSGLRWTCEHCRDSERDIAGFIRQTRTGFKDILAGFKKLSDNFSALDSGSPSPQPSVALDVPDHDITSLRLESPAPASILLSTEMETVEEIQPSPSSVEIVSAVTIEELPPAPTSVVRNTLVAVPPLKQIFVSRLSPDTTSDDVRAYIKSKSQARVKVDKFNFSYEREISSFKISVPAEQFSLMCSKEFWPEHLLVKEFVAKKKIGLRFLFLVVA